MFSRVSSVSLCSRVGFRNFCSCVERGSCLVCRLEVARVSGVRLGCSCVERECLLVCRA